MAITSISIERESAPIKRRKMNPRLSAPHSSVRVCVNAWALDDSLPRTVIVTYTGTREALIAAGAAEAAMFEGLPTAGSGTDSHGFMYGRRGRRDGRQAINRYIRTTQLLDTLPGIPSDAVPAAIRWCSAHPGQVHVDQVAHVEVITGTKESLIENAHVPEEAFEGFHQWNEIRHPRFGIARLSECLDGYFSLRGTRTQGSIDEELEATAPVNIRAAIQRHRDAAGAAFSFHFGEIEKLLEQERVRRARRQPKLKLVDNGGA